MAYKDLEAHFGDYSSNTNKKLHINYGHSIFSKGNKYRFPYNVESAFLIMKHCVNYTNSKNLIKSHYFKDNLNLHDSSESLTDESLYYDIDEFTESNHEYFENSKFSKSDLSQDEYFSKLQTANWSYENLIVSAIFFT